MANAISITSTSRPKRVAFFVHQDGVTNEEVDEIVKFSSTRWGGRYNPIIPTSGNEITSDWWALLKAVNPDIIYSFLPLSDGLVEKINRHILPAKIFEITPEDRQKRNGRIGVDEFAIQAISTHGIPKYLWSRRGGFGEPMFYYLQSNYWENSESQSFALRNFGVLPSDVKTSRMFREVQHRIFEVKNLTLESYFGPDFVPPIAPAIFPIDLSQIFANPVYTLNFQHQVSGFHLVIGDTPWEAIYLWNLAMQGKSNNGRNALWLPSSSADNQTLLKKIGEWIGKVYWGDHHHRTGVVVSYSLEDKKLQSLADEISKYARMHFSSVKQTNASHPFPASFEKTNYNFGLSFSQDDLQLTKRELVIVSGDGALVQFVKPPFLSHEENQTGLMVDLAIEYRPERYFYTNERPNWVLPKRVGVPSLFTPQGGAKARVISNGFPSFEVMTKDQSLKISIPSDRSVIWASLLETRFTNTDKNHVIRERQFEDIYTSDKGRYLNGILQLFSSLFHANHFFQDPFWRHIAYILAGRNNHEESSDKRRQRAHEVLKEFIEETDEPIVAGSEKLTVLADRIANQLTFREKESTALTLKEIKGIYSELRGRALQRNSKSNYWNAYKKYDVMREHDFNQYLEQNIFMQGIEVRCPNCYTTQWIKVDDLKSTVQCEGCLTDFPFPANPNWAFRINALIGNAIRYHGTIPVLLSLYNIERSSRNGMMLFLACQDIHKKDEQAATDDLAGITVRDGQLHIKAGSLYTDLDIVLIQNGLITIGEVKSDPSGFADEDFEKLKTVALDLLPDEVVLASVGNSWPGHILTKIDAFSLELSKADIRVTTKLMQWWEN